jgi:hypothetical protein
VAGACQEFGVPNLRSLSSGLDWVMKRCLQLVRGILGRPLIGGVEPVAASCGRIVSTVAVPIVQRDTATLSRRMPVTGRCPHRCGLRDGETDRPSSQADRSLGPLLCGQDLSPSPGLRANHLRLRRLAGLDLDPASALQDWLPASSVSDDDLRLYRRAQEIGLGQFVGRHHCCLEALR